MRTDVATPDGRHGVVEQVHDRWVFASSPEALAAAAPWLRIIWGDERPEPGRPCWACVTDRGVVASHEVHAGMGPDWWQELARQRAEEE